MAKIRLREKCKLFAKLLVRLYVKKNYLTKVWLWLVKVVKNQGDFEVRTILTRFLLCPRLYHNIA